MLKIFYLFSEDFVNIPVIENITFLQMVHSLQLFILHPKH